jgi:hypothetical protein
MNPIDFWKLCAEYSIVQAALLITGSDPEDLQFAVEHDSTRAPVGYIAVRTALVHAVRAGTLAALVVEQDNEYGGGRYVDVHETTIRVADLDAFVKSRGMVCAFFERSGTTPGDEISSGHQQYPPKLDAAIKAWKAVTGDPARLRGKSPKQALQQWLEEHAVEFGLVGPDGKPNGTGIEEICKVANWKPKGGATPTPGPALTVQPAPALIRLPSPAKKAPPPAPRETFDLDDEIPF